MHIKRLGFKRAAVARSAPLAISKDRQMSDAKYRKAFNLLKPNKPIETDEELETLYVERPDSPLEKLKEYLQGEDSVKLLFTGHSGSGKSSELSKLVSEIGEGYITLRYSAKRRLSLTDLSYLDLVVMIAIELVEFTKNKGYEIPDDLASQMGRLFDEILHGIVRETESKTKTTAELQARLATLSGKIGIEWETRANVREQTKPRLDLLFENIDLIAEALERTTGKKLLLIVDDLEKTSIDISRSLFHDHTPELVRPRISIIYTFPVALYFADSFSTIKQHFDKVFPLPNLKCQKRGGETDVEGIQKMEMILLNRIPREMISKEALSSLVSMSGGMPKQIIRMAQEALVIAGIEKKIDRDDLVISQDHAEQAIWSERRDFQLMLSTDDLDVLTQVQRSKTIEHNEKHLHLLRNMSIIAYSNREAWFDVHPLVKALLPQ